MSRKRNDRDNVPAADAKKPEDPGPLKHRAFDALKGARDALAEQTRAREAAEAAAIESKRKSLEAKGVKLPPVVKPRADANPAGGKPKPQTPEVWRPDMDKALFAVAMSGVVPLGAKANSARVHPAASAPGSRDLNARMRRARAEGGESIPVKWNEDGTCEAARRGKSFALEALGRFATPQDHLDLHGLEPTEARLRVEEFVRTRRSRGLRVVRVICGVGKHSPDNVSLLRDSVVSALSELPGAAEVDAFRSADSTQGGAGAMMVALRAT